jgi:hypothetical protein
MRRIVGHALTVRCRKDKLGVLGGDLVRRGRWLLPWLGAAPEAARPPGADIGRRDGPRGGCDRYLGRLGFRPPLSVFGSEVLLMHMYDAPPSPMGRGRP